MDETLKLREELSQAGTVARRTCRLGPGSTVGVGWLTEVLLFLWAKNSFTYVSSPLPVGSIAVSV